ncbi:MAG: fumarylacetoacetate hydrolase family protein [Segetibacter sp.]
MKLSRFGEVGNEKPCIIENNDQRKDVSNSFSDWNRMFFQKDGLKQLEEYYKNNSSLPNVPEDSRWASCVARPGKVICIGLNYSDHAAESGMSVPSEPIIFQKGANTVVGPYDPIIIPRNSTKTDWEVELGVVIGKDARYLSTIDEAKFYLAGFCIGNDVSERTFQLERGGQWTKGKSCDNFSPIGPFLLTFDEVEDVHNLSMMLSVNNRQMQKGNTKFMIF